MNKIGGGIIRPEGEEESEEEEEEDKNVSYISSLIHHIVNPRFHRERSSQLAQNHLLSNYVFS